MLGKQELIALILAQQEQICQLSARVAELEARLNLPPKTPSNSSLPPSKGQKANQPDKAKKLRKGHPGVARKLAENPDHVRDVFADACQCGKAASHGDQPEVYAYDHIDLPEIKPVVTRVNIHSGACQHCGKRIVIALRIVGAHGTARDLLRADGMDEKVGSLDPVKTLDEVLSEGV